MGLDITVKTIVDRIINISIPWGGSAILLDHAGTIMAMSSVREQLPGIPELMGHHYNDVIKQTGWKLLLLVPEENILATANRLDKRIRFFGLVMIFGAALFTLLFILSLFYRTRHTSRAIARPIDTLDQMAEKIGNGESTLRPPPAGIMEIDRMMENLLVMGEKLQQNQEVIRENEERLKTIFESANEGFWLIDNDSRTIDINPCMCRILGRKREDIIGRSIFNFVEGRNWKICQDQLAKRELGKSGTYEVAYSRPDLTQIPCLCSATPLMDDRGEKTGSFGMITDISVQKKTEAALHTLFQKSADGILLIERNKYIECNEAIVSMLKYKNKRELLQTHPSELSPEYQPDNRSSFQKAEEMIQICMESGTNRFEWV